MSHLSEGRGSASPYVEMIWRGRAGSAYAPTCPADSRWNLLLSTHELTGSGDTWRWTGEQTRCTAVFSDDGETQTAHHERLDEHGNWVGAMDVTLTKVE